MSIAPRPAKWNRASTPREGHSSFGQRRTFSPSGRTSGVPQTGQSPGILNARSSPVRRETTGAITSGMTSPARRTSTQSPTRMSLRAISSSLCRVAWVTVPPDSTTASNWANGVTAPVRPTWVLMSRRRVVFSSGGNL